VVLVVSATVKVFYDYGGSDNTPGTAHNVTDNGTNKLRFKQADNNTIDLVAPIPVPDSGTEYSFWKQVYLKCTAINDATQINNVQFYSDGAVFSAYTDVDVKIGDQLPTKNSGADTGYDVANAAEVMTNHSEVTSSSNASTLTSGSPLTVTISEAGNVIDATNETTDYVVMQLEVGSTASSGTLAAETLTYSYDEI